MPCSYICIFLGTEAAEGRGISAGAGTHGLLREALVLWEGTAPVPETAAAHKLNSERGRGLCDPCGEGFASCRSNSSFTSVKWRRLEGFQGLLGGWRGSEAGDGCQRLRASPSAAA